MSAPALLAQARAAGITLAVTADGQITAEGPPDGLTRLLPALRAHKAGLVALLIAGQQSKVVGLVGLGGFFPTQPEMAWVEDAAQEAAAERSAILEHEGGWPRTGADAVAQLAERYYSHHWSCPHCLSGTRLGDLRHNPCDEGARLWAIYAGAGRREHRCQSAECPEKNAHRLQPTNSAAVDQKRLPPAEKNARDPRVESVDNNRVVLYCEE